MEQNKQLIIPVVQYYANNPPPPLPPIVLPYTSVTIKVDFKEKERKGRRKERR